MSVACGAPGLCLKRRPREPVFKGRPVGGFAEVIEPVGRFAVCSMDRCNGDLTPRLVLNWEHADTPEARAM